MSVAARQVEFTDNRTIPVTVVAEEPRIRLKIAGLLAHQPPSLAVETAASCGELFNAADKSELLVLHCGSLGSDQLALVTQLRRERPGLMIVVVCDSIGGKNVRRVLDAGADGLALTEHLDVALAATLAAVLVGQTVAPRELLASVRNPSLSFREKQILGMVVMGFTNGEIGSRLFLAESTVKSHLSSAFSKLGVRSRSEAAAVILDPHGSLGTGILAITSHNGSHATLRAS